LSETEKELYTMIEQHIFVPKESALEAQALKELIDKAFRDVSSSKWPRAKVSD